MNHYSSYFKARKLNGAQKSAVLFLCLGEERGGALMQQLDVKEIRQISNAISTMGEVQAEIVEEIMQEFGEKVSEYGSIVGSVEAARGLLKEFLPEERVSEILGEIEDSKRSTVWEDLSAMNEKSLADIIRPEHNQTVALILSRIRPETAAKILPLLGAERAAELIQRMLAINNLSLETLQNVEDSIRKDILSKSGNNATALIEKQIVSVFNKLDEDMFNSVARELQQREPERFRSLKQQMFVFDDLAKLEANILSKVMREAGGNTLPLALRGAKKGVRDVFLAALPSRSRDMLADEMATMGGVRSRDAKAAQTELVEVALRLAAEGEIELPSDEEEEMLN